MADASKIQDGASVDKRLGPAISRVFLTNAFTGLLNFLVLIYFARTLGSSTVADYALVLLGIDLAFLALNFGFNQVLIFQGQLSPAVVAAVVWFTALQMLLASIVSCGVWLAYALIDPDSAHRYLGPGLWLLIAHLMGLWSTLAFTPLEIQLRYATISKMRALAAVAGSAVGVIAAQHEQALLAFIYRDLVSACICLVAGCALSYGRVQLRPTNDAIAMVWRYSKRMWALNVLERAALRIEYLIVASTLGRDVLGVYFALRSVVEGVFGFLVTPVQTVLFAYYCRSSMKDRVAPFLKYGLSACIAVALASYAIGLVWGENLIDLILGRGYQAAAQALGGLMFYCVCAIWFENVKALSMSFERHVVGIPGRIAQILVLSIGLPVTTQKLGLLGAGSVVAAGGLVLAVVVTVLLAKSSPPSLGAKNFR